MNNLNWLVLDSVVARLRLVLLTIALLAGCGALFGSSQLSGLQRSQQLLVSDSLPALVQSQKLVSLLASNLVLTNQLDVAASEAEVQALGKQLYANLESMINTVESEQGERQVDLAPYGFAEDLVVFQGATARVINLKASLLDLRQQILTHQSRLRDQEGQIRDVVEPAVTLVASELESILEKASSSASADHSLHAASISTLLEGENRLTQIEFHLARTFDMAKQLSIQSDNQVIDSTASRMQFALRSATQLLIRLNSLSTRQVLAKKVQVLRAQLFGERGLLEVLRSHHLMERQFKQARVRKQEAATSISDSVNTIVRAAQLDIEHNADTFQIALDRTVSFLLVVSLLVILIAGTVFYFVVEKQINRRMTKLTKAVLDIAKGDNERVVDVYGRDELASMANALVVFKRNARELNRSNEELEKFAYAASHDLRSPLRGIENLVEWILEDSLDQLPEDVVERLGLVLKRTKRLSDLQTGLLEYSQAGKEEMDVQAVDIHSLISELADLLDPDKQYSISLQSDCKVVATYLTPLRQILNNLITNAIKHHDQSSGSIGITLYESDARLHFTVADDGPGIAAQYHGRIFELFKTLRSRDEVEGSGLGLSLIRKQIEHYGGTITVQSDPSSKRGTSFQFDLPSRPMSEFAEHANPTP